MTFLPNEGCKHESTANMSHTMTGSRSSSMLPLPRNLYKSGLSTTSPTQSQFSSKCSTTCRIISGIKLLWGAVLYHYKFKSWLINLLKLALGEQLFSLIIYWFLKIFFFKISLQPRPRFWTQSLSKRTHLLFWKVKDTFQLKSGKIYLHISDSSLSSPLSVCTAGSNQANRLH